MYFKKNIVFFAAVLLGLSLPMSSWAMDPEVNSSTGRYNVYVFSDEPESKDTIVGEANLTIKGKEGDATLELKITDFSLFQDTFCTRNLREMENASLATERHLSLFAIRKIKEGITLIYKKQSPGKIDYNDFLLSLEFLKFETTYVAMKKSDGTFFLSINVISESNMKMKSGAFAFSFIPKK